MTIMKTVLFYSKEICPLCEEAEALLHSFQDDYQFKIKVCDIYSNDKWLEQYQLSIPVIEIEGHQLDCEQIGYDALDELLKAHITF